MTDTKQRTHSTLFEKLLTGILFIGAIGYILYIFFKGASKYHLFSNPLFYVVLLAICGWWILGLWAFIYTPRFQILISKVGSPAKKGELKVALIIAGYLVVGILGSLILGNALTNHGELFTPAYFLMIFPAGLIFVLLIYLFRKLSREKKGNEKVK